jgi:hypothetical protein
MAVTYFETSTASDLTGPSGTGGTSRSLVASRTAGGASADLASGNMNAGLFCNQNFFTPSGDPGTDGTSTGSFTVLVRCTAASVGGTVGIRVFLRRATGGDTGGTEVEASGGSQTAVASTTRTFTWTNPGLGTWASGDRLRIRVQLTNTSGSMNQSASIAVDTSDDTVATPFTAGSTDATPEPAVIATVAALPQATPQGDAAATPAAIAATAALPAATADGGGGPAIPSSPYGRYRASQLSLANNDPIDTWTDEGSGGNNLTASGTARPTYESAGFNSNASVLFDGTANFMETGTYASAQAQPNTIVLMGEMVSLSTTVEEYLCDGATSLGRHALIHRGPLAADNLSMYAGTQTNLDNDFTLTGRAGEDFCMVAIFNGTSSEFYYNNGADQMGTTTVGAQGLNSFQLMSRHDGFVSQQGAHARIVEVLIYNRVLTTQEITDLQSYFEATYAEAGGDATATPAVIAATAASPQAGVNVSSGPAQIAGTTALPQVGANVAAGPVAVAATATLPAASVNVSAGPSTIPLTVGLPAPTILAGGNVTATPDTIATVTALLQPAINIGTGPAAITAVTALPLAAVNIGATITPAAIAAVVALPAAAVITGGDAIAAPAAIAALLAMPAAAVNVSAGPAVTPIVVALPSASTSAGSDGTATPAVIAALAALPQPTIDGGTGVLPATIAATVAVLQSALFVSVAPSTIAVVVTFPATSGLGGLPDPNPIRLIYRQQTRLTHRETSVVVYREAQ